ncbi:MAG: MaoC like protein [Acidimicrobiales bacterium]|nr:MaoC like protein [Acidimicrobiales bacterium]
MNAWEAWIGTSHTTTAYLDPARADEMAVTLDREPIFAMGDELPAAWHWLYFHNVVRASRLGADGHPALGETMPPVPLPRRMWAGGDLTFTRPLRLGETAVRTSTVRDITEKRGRTGPLYFVSVEHDIRVDGAPALAETQTIVYREMPSGPAVVTGPAAPDDAQFSDTWQLDSTALFRYSALTFNGHRIHYDADYCRSVEGYPNVVIHGPLLATLLVDLAVRRHGPLHSFRYRAESPLFIPDTFTINGRREGDRSSLWAASADGRLAMSAEATAATERADPAARS